MTHYRARIREVLRLAFRIDPHFADVTQMTAWSKAVDEGTLPVLGIVTPREVKDASALKSGSQTGGRNTTGTASWPPGSQPRIPPAMW